MDITALTNSFKALGKKIKDFWQKRSTLQKRLMITLSVVAIVLLAVVITLFNRVQYSVLYTNLDAAEAGTIIARLQELSVDAKAQGTDTVLVPKSQVDSLRMQLASEGLPQNSLNLDILEKGTGFGITEEDKAVYRRYQLQQDLQNAIKTFTAVEDARVSLIIPRESTFVIEDQQTAASAAVLLTLKSGKNLAAENVQAIIELVEKSVTNLSQDNITVIDSNMNVLNGDQSSVELDVGDQQSLQQQVGERLEKQVGNLLQPVFGIGKVLTEVHVSLNFDEKVVENITFSPAEGSSNGVISNIEKIREKTQAATTSASGEAGTNTNGAGVTTYPVQDTGNDVYEKNSDTISYEINTIKETLKKAKGTIEDLSVSVVIDSTDQPTGQNYSENVRNLVATAVGVKPDYITVEYLPFSGQSSLDASWEDYQAISAQAQNWQKTRFFILLGTGVFILLVLAFILRKMKNRKTAAEPAPVYTYDPQDGEMALNAVTAARAANLETADQAAIATVLSKRALHETSPLTLMDQADRKLLEDSVEQNPDLAASIIRSWLSIDS
ncbi:MAG: flagellar basal-body MS-ring/collar protein FliF [Clostridiaceae bacterium]|nr:flagellar basal-body MS-ring/collar protein FliF [Clostridiaceae bacterium]